MQSQSLIKTQPTQLAPVNSMDDWQLMRQQADVLKASGFLPQAIKSAEAAMAIILIGRELNIPMMTALNNINVIQGKITVPPQLMMAMINRTGELEDLKVSDDGGAASCLMKRKGRAAHTESFSMADAQKMQLDQKDNWRKQPRTMRKWRAIAACARVVFPDVITGLYTPEEMGAHVNDDGEIDLAMAEVIEEKPKAKTARAALKAVPKQEPVIEAEPVIERGEPLPLRAEQVEALEAVEPEDDPLPDFMQSSTETPEQIEAERIALVNELEGLIRESLKLKEKTPDEIDALMDEYWRANDIDNQTRGWLRTKIEKAQLHIVSLKKNLEPVAITHPKDAPAELPDGRRKMQRTDAEGNSIAAYEGSHMKGRQATHEETIQNLDYWIDYWRTHTTMGQDLATIRQKVARVVGEFHDWSDLKGVDLSKAIRTLQQWRPDLDKKPEAKGAKR